MQPIRSSRKGTLRILESKKPPPVGGGGFVGDHAGSQGLFAFRVSFSSGGNPRPREGGDVQTSIDGFRLIAVSIHAPVKEATINLRGKLDF